VNRARLAAFVVFFEVFDRKNVTSWLELDEAHRIKQTVDGGVERLTHTS